VMDNYSLRDVLPTATKMVSNPDRETQGATASTLLNLSDRLTLELGAEHQRNEHSLRKAMSMVAGDAAADPDYQSQTRIDDMRFTSNALFAEATPQLDGGDRLHAGLRVTRDGAEDLRSRKTTSGTEDNQWLTSAFARYEQQLNSNTCSYIGLGYTERAADYWERTSNPKATSSMMTGSASHLALDPEQSTQMEIGQGYISADNKA